MFLRATPIQPFSLEIFAVRVDLLPQGLDGVPVRASERLDLLKSIH